MFEFTMPSLGADMEEGTFVEWLVQPRQEVKRGEIACVVETQKGAVEVEIWAGRDHPRGADHGGSRHRRGKRRGGRPHME
jgi:Biotin-requiring enzyme